MDLTGDRPVEADEANITLSKLGPSGGRLWIPQRTKDRKNAYWDAAKSFPVEPRSQTSTGDRRTTVTYAVADLADGTYSANTVSHSSDQPYKVIFTIKQGKIVQVTHIPGESPLHREGRASGYRRPGKRTMTLARGRSSWMGHPPSLPRIRVDRSSGAMERTTSRE